jgi:predicted ribosome quality control (RQC) complex YloA/Tae2 family protein
MAAELAVYYSKQRDGGKTPVHYCPAREVGKEKGAKPGQVTIRQALKLNVYPKEHSAALIED